MRNTRLSAALLAMATFATVVTDARAMYDAKHGRWLQRDPIGTGDIVTHDQQGGPRITVAAAVSAPTRIGISSRPPMGNFIPRDAEDAQARIRQDRLRNPYVDGMNLYQFVRSNPQRLIDPRGLATQCCAGKQYDDTKQCCKCGKIRDLFMVCIRSGTDHSWIHARNLNSDATHSYGRWKEGYGGTTSSGVQTDIEGSKNRKYAAERCCITCDYQATINSGYAVRNNNCATYAASEYKRACGETVYSGGWIYDDPSDVVDAIRDANGGSDSNAGNIGGGQTGGGSSGSSNSSSGSSGSSDSCSGW